MPVPRRRKSSMPFNCTICGEESTRICVWCTKDTCANHFARNAAGAATVASARCRSTNRCTPPPRCTSRRAAGEPPACGGADPDAGRTRAAHDEPTPMPGEPSPPIEEPAACRERVTGARIAGINMRTPAGLLLALRTLRPVSPRPLPAKPFSTSKITAPPDAKPDDARPAIQNAIDAAGAAGGGTVYCLRANTRPARCICAAMCASSSIPARHVYASLDGKAFDKAALLYGEGVDNITIEGRGTVDGQASYIWRPTATSTTRYIRENMLLAKALGKPLMRSFPAGFPHRADVSAPGPAAALQRRAHRRAFLRAFAQLDHQSLCLRTPDH